MAQREEHIEKLGKLITEVKIAMLTTEEPDGTLRSRPMATQKTEFDGKIWFFTRASSPKVDEVTRHRSVNVSYANPDSNTYVSVSGPAELVRDAVKNKELWNPILKAWFPKGLDDPDLALLRVDVEQAEFWDVTSSTMVQIAGFLKAMVSGKSYSPSGGEHEKINL